MENIAKVKFSLKNPDHIKYFKVALDAFRNLLKSEGDSHQKLVLSVKRLDLALIEAKKDQNIAAFNKYTKIIEYIYDWRQTFTEEEYAFLKKEIFEDLVSDLFHEFDLPNPPESRSKEDEEDERDEEDEEDEENDENDENDEDEDEEEEDEEDEDEEDEDEDDKDDEDDEEEMYDEATAFSWFGSECEIIEYENVNQRYNVILEEIKKGYKTENYAQALTSCQKVKLLCEELLEDFNYEAPEESALQRVRLAIVRKIEEALNSGVDFARDYNLGRKTVDLQVLKSALLHVVEQGDLDIPDMHEIEEPLRFDENDVESSKDSYSNLIDSLKLSKPKTNVRPIRQVLGDIGSGLLEGGTLAAADQFNEIVVDAISLALIDAGVPQNILETDIARNVGKVVAPCSMMIASNALGDRMPGSDLIYKGSQKALSVASLQVILPALSKLRPKFKRLEEAAERLEPKSLTETEIMPDPVQSTVKKHESQKTKELRSRL